MSSSLSGPPNPNDRLFTGGEELGISGPDLPQDQFAAEAPERRVVNEDEAGTSAAAGAK